MNIRGVTHNDAEAINLLISEVASLCHEDFGPEGLVNFLVLNTQEKIRQRIKSNEYFSLLCEIEKQIVGIITVKAYAKLDQLFVHPRYHRQGIARKLWQEALIVIKKNTQAAEITVKSSTMGIKVYQSFGFKLAGGMSTSGDIRYYPMSLTLDEEV